MAGHGPKRQICYGWGFLGTVQSAEATDNGRYNFYFFFESVLLLDDIEPTTFKILDILAVGYWTSCLCCAKPAALNTSRHTKL